MDKIVTKQVLRLAKFSKEEINKNITKLETKIDLGAYITYNVMDIDDNEMQAMQTMLSLQLIDYIIGLGKSLEKERE